MFVVTYKKIFLSLGLIFMAISATVVAYFGLNLGIDFAGGALTEVVYQEKPEASLLEDMLSDPDLDLGGFSLRETVGDGGKPGYILRSRDLSDEERVKVSSLLVSEGEGGEVTRFTSIGPVIGQELRDKAVWAISAVVLIIIIYVAFAFRGVSYPVGGWVYGGITIIALAHDILIPTALMAVLGFAYGVEVDVLFVMALLAVLGYSVNDTIVVFDRVRENLQQFRTEKKVKKNVGGVIEEEVTYKLNKPFQEIVGLSVSQTITRSINTSITTLVALTALYFFGAEVTKTFALILTAGVLAGTYSSLFFANPLLIYMAERKAKQEGETLSDK